MANSTTDEGSQMDAAQSAQEKRAEEERMRDVVVLLDNLFRQEEVTLKLVINCLYDIAAVDFVNQRVPNRPLNRFLKSATRVPKPALRQIILWRLQKTCPQLVANWLYGQVKKATQPKRPVRVKTTPVAPPVPVMEVEVASQQLEASRSEIRRLRSQVRLLTGALIGAIAVMGTAAVWVSRDLGYELGEMIMPFGSARVESIEQTGAAEQR